MRPDALVVFTADHMNTFFLDNLPLFSVGVADRTTGPNDGTPALPRYDVPVAEGLAAHVRERGIAAGFDLALTQEFAVDHSVLVPLHFLTPAMRIPIVPLFIAGSAPCGRAPDTRLGRALDWARKRERRVRRVSGRLYTLQPEADAHYL